MIYDRMSTNLEIRKIVEKVGELTELVKEYFVTFVFRA